MANRVTTAATGIPQSTVAGIIKEDLKMKELCGKWVPQEINELQRAICFISCRANIKTYNKGKGILKRTVSIDESWVALYMQPDKTQAAAWLYPGEKPKPVPKQNIHGANRMLIIGMC